MSRLVARAESYEKVYNAFQNVNFAAFDFNSVKQSLVDYIKLYFPETFNDYIESSELIAIIETFAYIAELLAYRIDVSAHENFLSTAQRKDSVLRLAKFISYTASRPLPSRGLVKITSVRTTESISDAVGNNLANRTISWNDVSNPSWKDQFILILNRALQQGFGTVSPTDRFQIQNILFELYSLNMTSLPTGVFTYNASVNGQSVPMELVPITHDTSLGIVERRPTNNSDFTILYGQDGLGDASDTTGFFCFTKQGTLQRFRTVFDGVTPNQTYDITVNNVNDTDVWVNNVDSVTGEILNIQSTLPYRAKTLAGKSGEWVAVDLAHAQNVIFNTNPKRNKYEVETLTNNQVRIIFGDGEFADVPSGTFDVWARTSLDKDITIPQSSIVNASSSFTYVDGFGRTQTFTFTYSLISSLQNASASEDVEHVRATAPSVYYSQDRMVNGQDYNNFMLQDPSILKLRAINRTFAGDSKYITWHDPSGTYENIKIFSDDGIVYFEDIPSTTTTPVIDTNTLIATYIEPLLSSTDLLVQLLGAGVPAASIRRVFNTQEKTRIITATTPPPTPVLVDLYYNKTTFEWFAIKNSDDPIIALAGYPTDFLTDFITTPLITVNQISIFETNYNVTHLARRLVFQSSTTSFWNNNNASRVIEYSTLNSDYDEIDILQANTDYNRAGILSQTWRFYVLGQENIDSGTELGLLDISRLSILPVDENNTGIPPGLNINDYTSPQGLADIVKPKYFETVSSGASNVLITLPIYYIGQSGDVTVTDGNGTGVIYTTLLGESPTGEVSNTITITNTGTNTSLLITVNEYVYFTRLTFNDPWLPAPTTVETINSYVLDSIAVSGLWKRHVGRNNLNFVWFHRTPRYHLVDPAASNIVDSFVITKGYYLSLKNWLEDPLAAKPTPPTPLDLRTTYGYLLDNKMISDTVVLHSGNIKLLFGTKATPALQASFLVIRAAHSTLTDNQIKTAIVTTIRNFFDITLWELGETFYAVELFTAVQMNLPTDISSIVIAPTLAQNHFGNLFQVVAREDEVFYPDITVDNIQIVTGYTNTNLNSQ